MVAAMRALIEPSITSEGSPSGGWKSDARTSTIEKESGASASPSLSCSCRSAFAACPSWRWSAVRASRRSAWVTPGRGRDSPPAVGSGLVRGGGRRRVPSMAPIDPAGTFPAGPAAEARIGATSGDPIPAGTKARSVVSKRSGFEPRVRRTVPSGRTTSFSPRLVKVACPVAAAVGDCTVPMVGSRISPSTSTSSDRAGRTIPAEAPSICSPRKTGIVRTCSLSTGEISTTAAGPMAIESTNKAAITTSIDPARWASVHLLLRGADIRSSRSGRGARSVVFGGPNATEGFAGHGWRETASRSSKTGRPSRTADARTSGSWLNTPSWAAWRPASRESRTRSTRRCRTRPWDGHTRTTRSACAQRSFSSVEAESSWESRYRSCVFTRARPGSAPASAGGVGEVGFEPLPTELDGLRQLPGVLAAGLGHRRAAAAAAADGARGGPHQLDGAQPALRQIIAERCDQDRLVLELRAEQDGVRRMPAPKGIRELAQVVGAAAGDQTDQNARRADRFLGQLGQAAFGGRPLEFFDARLERLAFAQESLQLRVGAVGRGLEQVGDALQCAPRALEGGLGLAPGEGFDSPNTGADALFADDDEWTDDAGRRDVRPTPHFIREPRGPSDRDRAHGVAVGFPEEGHGAFGLRLAPRLFDGGQRVVLQDGACHQLLHLRHLVRRQWLTVGEIEAQAVS